MLGDISGLEKIYIVCGYTDYPIIREELLFEKISVIIVNSGILNNSSRIIFYFLFRKSGILVLTSFTSTLLPNHVSFHSLSFLSTDSCDISA